jgi:hypothetical protein
MDTVPTILFIASAVVFAWAGARYFRNGRYANSDRTGADITFHHMWLLSTILMAVATGLLPGPHWTWGVAVAGGGFILSVPAKTFVGRVFRMVGWGARLHPDDAPPSAAPFGGLCRAEARARRRDAGPAGEAPHATSGQGSGQRV